MKAYQIEVHVAPREGILDPQGKAVESALHSLGFERATEVHVGRLLRFTLEAGSADEARAQAEEMCRALLANPVTEDFDLEVREPSGAAA